MLGNLQVAFVPLVAWAVLSERPGAPRAGHAAARARRRRARSPARSSRAPTATTRARACIFGAATGLTYAGFILLLRAGGADLRRPAGPLLDATVVATVTASSAGLIIGDADLVPSWPAHGWLVLLAMTSQVIGWLLISSSLPRLPAALTSLLLTIQPIGSVLLGALIFAETPTALQIAGVGAILAGLVLVSRVRPAAPEPVAAAAGP